MGYYVRSYESDNNFKVRKENFDAAYKAMVALNDHDDLKRGGSFGPEGARNKWFSWMDPNYPDSCQDFGAILQALGFIAIYDETGLVGIDYDNKMGQEDLFLKAIAPYVEDGSHILWRGEEGAVWVQIFKNGTIETHEFDLEAIIFTEVFRLLEAKA